MGGFAVCQQQDWIDSTFSIGTDDLVITQVAAEMIILMFFPGYQCLILTISQ